MSLDYVQYILFPSILFLTYRIWSALSSPLSHIPGPFLSRFTKFPWFLSIYRGNFHHENITLHHRYAPSGRHYAPIIRLGPHLHSIASPDRQVYGITSRMAKGSWYDGWRHPDPNRWTLFPVRDMALHANARRIFSPVYAMSTVIRLESYVDTCVALFEGSLQRHIVTGERFDMAKWLQFYAFDVIGEITYRKRFGFLEEGKDIAGLITALDASMIYSTLVGVYSWLHPYLYKIMEKLPGSGASGRNYIIKTATQKVQEKTKIKKAERKQGDTMRKSEAPEDFLDRMVNMLEDGTKGVTPYHLVMLSISNIIAGSDTTGSSLCGILYHMIKTPRVMLRLREELKCAERVGKDITFSTCLKLRYLQACLKEGLRLAPAAGLPLWRVVPDGGATICGQFFPGGEEVGINIWVAHYDRDVWGDDVEVFRPERWIEAEDEGGERIKAMETNYAAVSL